MSNYYTLTDLIDCFEHAIEFNADYVGVLIQMEGYDDEEIIINPRRNFIEKLEYYKQTYEYDLTHKHAGDKVKIVDFTYEDTLEEIERFYLNGGS